MVDKSYCICSVSTFLSVSIITPVSRWFLFIFFKIKTSLPQQLAACQCKRLAGGSPTVFVSSPPPAGISVLIWLLNLFHSQISHMSSWVRRENESGSRYPESEQSRLWQNNLYALASPLIYLEASALTVLQHCACSDHFCWLDDCWVPAVLHTLQGNLMLCQMLLQADAHLKLLLSWLFHPPPIVYYASGASFCQTSGWY